MIKKKILVIDDDKRAIKSIKLSLEEYKIIGFENSSDALMYLKKNKDVDLVITDIVMPDLNGIDLLKTIRKVNKEIKVILMTGYGTKDMAIDALRNGADDFIEKPFSVDFLRNKVQKFVTINAVEKNYDLTDYVDGVKDFVDKNHNNASLSAVSELASLSPKYLSRVFRNKTGITFREYKLQVKMDYAKTLLANTRMMISDISDNLGYQNPESFMRVFKRIFAMTPRQYRNENKK